MPPEVCCPGQLRPVTSDGPLPALPPASKPVRSNRWDGKASAFTATVPPAAAAPPYRPQPLRRPRLPRRSRPLRHPRHLPRGLHSHRPFLSSSSKPWMDALLRQRGRELIVKHRDLAQRNESESVFDCVTTPCPLLESLWTDSVITLTGTEALGGSVIDAFILAMFLRRRDAPPEPFPARLLAFGDSRDPAPGFDPGFELIPRHHGDRQGHSMSSWSWSRMRPGRKTTSRSRR